MLGLLFLLLHQSPALSAPPAANSNRFLLLLDTSLAMKPLETAQRETTFDLVYSGLRGQMTNGDTYGLWLAGEKNDTSFPMESWNLKHAVELAAKAAVHVKDRGYKGRGGLDTALADAKRVVQNVGDLTVVLVSNGETPVKGTPFDDAINARFTELAPVMKQAGVTLNTVLVAQDGEFVAWAVNSPEFLIEMPSLPARTGKKKFQAAQAEKAAATAKAEAAAEKPRVAIPPLIITKESVAQEKRSYSAAATMQVEPALVAATNAVASNAVSTVAIAPANNNPAAVNPTTTTNSPALVSSSKTAATNAVLVVAVPVTSSNVAVLTALAPKPAVPPETAMAPPVSSAPPSASVSVVLWAAAGAGAMLIVVLVALLFARSRRTQPSLISQALVRERLG